MSVYNDRKPLRVMLVDDDVIRASCVEESLRASGFEVLSIISRPAALLFQIEQHRPDVVIIDLHVPARDILESLTVVNAHNPTAMVMFSEDNDPDYIQKAFNAGISTYQIEGIKPELIKPIIEVALAQFRSFQAVKNELKSTQIQLADQKAIYQAKALLMKHKKMTEDKAHKLLCKLAMENNQKIGDVAKTVISTLSILENKPGDDS